MVMGPEEVLHRQAAGWLRAIERGRFIWWHSPNGAKMTKATAGIHKALGMRAGVPDLAFIFPGGRARFIELKAKKNYPTPEQRAFLKQATEWGSEAVVCKSLEEVQAAVGRWLSER